MTVDVHVAPPPVAAPRRSNTMETAMVASALALAVLAALASQVGVPKAQPLVGAVVILGIAYAFSTNRRAIDARIVAWGLGLQVLFALVVLKTSVGQRVFSTLGEIGRA